MNYRLGPGEISYFIGAIERGVRSQDVAANLRRVGSAVSQHALQVAEELFGIDMSDMLVKRLPEFVKIDAEYVRSLVKGIR